MNLNYIGNLANLSYAFVIQTGLILFECLFIEFNIPYLSTEITPRPTRGVMVEVNTELLWTKKVNRAPTTIQI